jgi:hypothetical protein
VSKPRPLFTQHPGRWSELARTIPAAYQAEEVNVQAYEVLFPLYEVPKLARQARHI